MADQHEMDKLNDDIRRLTQENKTAFATRMKLEADKNKLENLLTNNLIRRRDELVQVNKRVHNHGQLEYNFYLFKVCLFLGGSALGVTRNIFGGKEENVGKQ